MNGRCPNPWFMHFAQHPQSNAIFGEQLNGLIATGHCNEFTVRKVIEYKWIKAQRTLSLAYTLSAKRVKWNGLWPIGNAQNIRVAGTYRVQCNAINWAVISTGPFNFTLFIASLKWIEKSNEFIGDQKQLTIEFPYLIANGHRAICQAQCQVLAIICPSTAIDTRRYFEFLDSFLFGWPKCEIGCCTRYQLMRHWIEWHALDRIVVAVNSKKYTSIECLSRNNFRKLTSIWACHRAYSSKRWHICLNRRMQISCHRMHRQRHKPCLYARSMCQSTYPRWAHTPALYRKRQQSTECHRDESKSNGSWNGNQRP